MDISKGDTRYKERRLAELNQYKVDVAGVLDSLSNKEMLSRLEQEANELIYYVKQRVFLRFMDFYHESFNPATLKSGGNYKKQLKEAMEQLLESVGFDLAQELRATSLRTDNYIVNSLIKLQERVNERLNQISSELSLSIKEYSYENALDFKPAFTGLESSYFQKALSIYKNPKDFFEGGMSKILCEDLEQIMSNLADVYLDSEKEKIIKQETEALSLLFDKVCLRYKKRLDERITTDIAALDGGLDPETLETIYNKL